jgi:hypothetical protein
MATYTDHEITSRPFTFLKSNFQTASRSLGFVAATTIVHWLVSAIEVSDELYERRRFQFSAIVHETNRGTIHDWKGTVEYNFELLQYALYKEIFFRLYSPDPSKFEYPIELLRQQYTSQLLE